MITALFERIRLLLRRLWVRVVAIALLSVVAVLASKLIGPVLPATLGEVFGAASVDRLLDILSSSMLAVTTFSLTVIVTVHRAVSLQWTPRAHRIQLRDSSSQMVLATFMGAFIYALVSIILRAASVFDEREILVLFATTLVVLLLVVVMLLRWIVRLQTMGSLADIADRIQDLTVKAVRNRMGAPCLGAQALTADVVIPAGAREVRAKQSGYVVRIFPSVIEEKARACDGVVFVLPMVGDYVSRGAVLARVTDPGLVDCVRTNVEIGEMRDLEQDPAFGLRVLAEIASKALSPGVNDGGTAIDMIDRMTWVLESWDGPRETVDNSKGPRETVEGSPRHDHLFIRPFDPAQLVVGPFGMVARDGVDVLEVQQVIQARLADLARHPDPDIAAAADRLRREALARAREAITFEADRRDLGRDLDVLHDAD